MMKKLLFLLFIGAFLVPTVARAQKKGKKLTTEEAAQKTPDQRFVYESERKAKSKKKKQLSTKQKVRVQEKQEAKVRKKKNSDRRR